MPSVDVGRVGFVAPPAGVLTLRALLRAQPDASLLRLATRRGLELDPHKQLDTAEQVARGLAMLPRGIVEALGPTAREALLSLVARPGWAARSVVGGGALALVESGLAFAHPEATDALAVPAAYRLQLPAPRAEHRHAARALLASLDPETREDVVLAFHARRVTSAWPLALEGALVRLESETELDRFLGTLDRAALLALSAIEARGGEVSLDAYLDLCREPARWTGARVPRRGIAFQLVSAALVLPDGEGRLVMPVEVQERVGRERREVLARRRAAAIGETAGREDEPQRATLGLPPGVRAVAAWLETGAVALPGRVVVARAARRAGTSFEATSLLATLLDATPLRATTLESVSDAVLETWRSGHAWDEIRSPPRVPPEAAPDTPTVVLRACVLDALASLPRGRFAERATVRAAIESDLRFDGVRTAFERGRTRRDADWVPDLDLAIDRLLDLSLPTLGLVDVAPDGSLRLASWARDREQARSGVARRPTPASVLWHDGDRARLAGEITLASLAPLATIADAVADGSTLVLTIDPARVTLERRDAVLAALTRLAHPDVDGFAARCPRPRGAARAVRASWVVVVEPADLAAELRVDPQLARWLVAPHPDGPFLVFVDSAARGPVLRALGRLGVEVELPRASARSGDPRRPRRARRTNRS